MRSSNKSRSRNKNNNNRNRNVGNVINRVFDSAGPEGRVRGTPAQIIEKYQSLARDGQLSGDRVSAENFQQHAEHYLRLLGEAQREQAERQAQHEAQQAQQRQQHEERNSGQQGNAQHGNNNGNDRQPVQTQPQAPSHSEGSPQPDIIDVPEANADSGLVETPESAPKPKRAPRTRRPAKPKADAQPDGAGPSETVSSSVE